MVKTKEKTTTQQSSQDVLRTTNKSREKAKNRRLGAGRTRDTLVRTSSLPMTRSSSNNSSSNNNTDHEEGESTSDERLVLNVTVDDTSIVRKVTPRKEDFIKDANIRGIKSRIGWTPKRFERFDDRSSSNNVNRRGRRFKEHTLRHEYINKSDIDLLENLNRNTFLYDINEDDLAQLRSITLKTLNNLERVYRKIRRGDQYSHFSSISRNIQRNFRV